MADEFVITKGDENLALSAIEKLGLKKWNRDHFNELETLNKVKFQYYHHFYPWDGFFDHLYRFLNQFKDKEDQEIALRIVDDIIFFSQEEIFKGS